MIEKCARKGAEMYQEQLVADEPDEYGSEESDNDAIYSEQEDVEDWNCFYLRKIIFIWGRLRRKMDPFPGYFRNFY